MTRSRTLGLVRALVAVLVLTAVAVAVARNWRAVSGDLAGVDPGALAVATLLVVLGSVLTMLGWRVLLGDLGSRIHLAPAAGIFFVGQLGKYLPGSVWSVVAQAEMGARLDIPRRRSAVVGLIGIGLSILTGLLVGLPALPLLLRAGHPGTPLWLLLAVPLLVLGCWPRLLNRVIALALRLLRREPLEHELSGRAILGTVGLYLLAWLCFGAHVWVLTRSVAGFTGDRDFWAATVAGYALAASAGMLVVVVPAGVGVREGLLVLLLGATVAASAAGAVVLLSRFIITVVDVLMALAGWAYARRHRLLSAATGRDPALVTTEVER